MNAYSYEEIDALAYDKVRAISMANRPFKITAKGKIGHRIADFLANEAAHQSRPRTFRSRLHYLLGSRVGFFIPGFIPLWNCSIMDGYTIQVLDQSEDFVEVVFSPRG